MSATGEPRVWDARACRDWIAVPGATDDKYSRGVLAVVTGSSEYPGAAVLSVEAAARAGVGLVRYVGPAEPTRLVLERRPEVIVQTGAAQAVLAGSGMVPESSDPRQAAVIDAAFADATPLVLDAGMLTADVLTRVRESDARESGIPCVVTPHACELARLLTALNEPVDAQQVSREPALWSARLADLCYVTVLLKGAVTHVVGPAADGSDAPGERFHAVVPVHTHWLASAGTGDVLAGVLGALVATNAAKIHSDAQALPALAATAAWIHARAGELAGAGGPLVALDVAQSVSRVIAEVLA